MIKNILIGAALVGLLLQNIVAADSDKPLKIYLFYTNDLRGGVETQRAVYMNPLFPPVLGGGAAAATIVQHYRNIAAQTGDAVLLIDGGDIFKGPPAIGRNSKGLAIVRYMNAIGYDAMVPGIHDFDFGRENLLKLAEAAQFPVLAANVFDAGSRENIKQMPPEIIIDKEGVKLGLFGIVSQSAEQNDDSAAVGGLAFGAEIPAAQKAVQRLKQQGADIVIALAHLGLPYEAEEGYRLLQEMDAEGVRKDSYVDAMELAHFVSGIDVLLSGKINRGYNRPWEDPQHHTICLQNYANGGNLGLIVLKIDRNSHSLIGYDLPARDGGLLLLSEDEYWPQKEMAVKIDSLRKQYAPHFDDVIGVTLKTLYRSTRGESPMGDLMCDAMLQASGADFAFNNFVSMRQDIPIGPVTPRIISQVFPFGNRIAVISMMGSLLRKLIENSIAGGYGGMAIAGGRVVYDSARPDGAKITEIFVGNQPVDPEQTYHVATTEYLAEGNYGMTPLAFLPDSAFKWMETTVRDAVVDYVKEHSPLNVELDGRWVRK